MDRPIVDGRWRVHINGEGLKMEWVIMIYEFTSLRVYERSSRAKRVVLWVMLSSDGVLFLFSVLIECSHTVAPVQCTHTNPLTLTPISHHNTQRKYLECSSSHSLLSFESLHWMLYNHPQLLIPDVLSFSYP